MNQNQKGILGEKAVNEVASNTFLKYWCYPNPKDESGTKKEICDLLIIFKKTLIIVSIKNYEFKGNYERYFRNTLKKAISQIRGAEKKLFQSSKSITFHHPLKGEFKFDPSNYDTVQRIIVNINTAPLFYPAGTLNPKDNFIHVFNWFAFLTLVNELDTIPDFVQYLKEREKTFLNKQVILLTGQEDDWTADTNKEFLEYSQILDPREKLYITISGNELDLLANYFFNDRKYSKEFYSDEYSDMHFELDGKWDDYISREKVRRKKEEDKMSYFIDKLVEEDILYFDHDNRIEMASELLALSRFERRIAGNNFESFIRKYRGRKGLFMARRYGVFGDLTIGYFLHGDKIGLNEAMNMMQIAVQGYSYWEGYKSKRILMIGINSSLTQTKFAYNKNIQRLSKKEEEDLIHDLKLLNWFQRIEEINTHWKEYPDK